MFAAPVFTMPEQKLLERSLFPSPAIHRRENGRISYSARFIGLFVGFS
jgi:hypothetical protein